MIWTLKENTMRYTTVKASEEQMQALFERHLKPGIKKYGVEYDQEDDMWYIALTTRTDKEVVYQLRRGDTPMFASFRGFGRVRYDVDYIEESHPEMFAILRAYALEAKKQFWEEAKI